MDQRSLQPRAAALIDATVNFEDGEECANKPVLRLRAQTLLRVTPLRTAEVRVGQREFDFAAFQRGRRADAGECRRGPARWSVSAEPEE